MNHLVVTRVVVGIGVLCLTAALSFAWLRSSLLLDSNAAAPMQAADRGATLFGRHCASCHQPDSVAGPLRGAAGDAEAQRVLDLLRSHGKSDDAEDRAIVSYLRGLADGS
jgi:mono/diheme cytochrome c family protein